MKIKKVEIKNIASIEDATIDFENSALKDAPLFLICGETGTGKTTILDAITLALYCKTPRYSKDRADNTTQFGGIAYNSIKQLVRRGAKSASAKVTLLGNDGTHYEACWSVNENTNGNNPSWQWKNCTTGETFSRKHECKDVYLKAVGFEFDQFCRTSMLAQGQFAKFIEGSDGEKAEILEKLTNTERFTEIGMAIANKNSELNSKVKDIKTNLESMQGLGDERANIEAELKRCEEEAKVIVAKLESLRGRKDWKENFEDCAKNNDEIKQKLALKGANLMASKGAVEAKIAKSEEEVAEIKSFLSEKMAMEPMYDKKEAILQNLRTVRDMRNKIASAEKEKVALSQKLEGLKNTQNGKQAELDKIAKEIAAKDEELNREKSILDEMNIPNLRTDKDNLQTRKNKIQVLQVRRNNISGLKEELQGLQSNLENSKVDLAKKEAELPTLEKSKEEAKIKCDNADEERDKISNLVKNGIDAIIATLHEGDECPICKSKIEHLNCDKYYAKLNAELQKSFEEAKNAYSEAERAYNFASAAITEAKKNIASLEKQLAEKNDAIAELEAEVQNEASTLGICDLTNIRSEIEKCESEIATIQTKIREGEAQNRKCDDINKELTNLQRGKDSAQREFDKAKDESNNCENRIGAITAQIQENERAEKDAFITASSQIICEGWKEKWEENGEAWEAWLQKEAREYRDKNEMLQRKTADIESQKNNAKLFEECVERLQAQLPSIDVNCKESGCVEERIISTVDSLLGEWRNAQEKLQELQDSMPQDFSENDTVDSLTVECGNLESKIDETNRNIGSLQEKLNSDDECATRRKEKEEELRKAQEELNDWKPIHDNLGTGDGAKFKAIIQSYILGNVLHKANFYLRTLNPRYTLSSSALKLSVIDSYEGNAERPVETLSGGEKFLVSLSLALGLAGMNDKGLGVEMLFIDEGFGTLSGEYLNAAIETLEGLNRLTGSRKVGVISHVECLRERIHTHIEVTKSGSEPSKIKII